MNPRHCQDQWQPTTIDGEDTSSVQRSPTPPSRALCAPHIPTAPVCLQALLPGPTANTPALHNTTFSRCIYPKPPALAPSQNHEGVCLYLNHVQNSGGWTFEHVTGKYRTVMRRKKTDNISPFRGQRIEAQIDSSLIHFWEGIK